MTFSELSNFVSDINNDERRMSVRFGCDCGCGGDSYTDEYWDDMCDRADEAVKKLKEFGVVFREEEE